LWSPKAQAPPLSRDNLLGYCGLHKAQLRKKKKNASDWLTIMIGLGGEIYIIS